MHVFKGVAAVMFIASAMGAAPASAQTDLSNRIYDWVMSAVREYEDLPEPKVMAICIEWSDAEGKLQVRNLFAYYTARVSDGPIFVESLAQSALHSCRQWRKKERIDCDCRMLDKNGRNVLKTPK